MMPGPIVVIACPHCQGLLRYVSLMSGNTLGGQIWTDGRQQFPKLPQISPVMICSHCDTSYWLDNAREVGQYSQFQKEPDIDPAWTTAPGVRQPNEKEYYLALEAGLARDFKKGEQIMRTRAWWRRNDDFRFHRKPFEQVSGVASHTPEPWRKNLIALADLLDEADESELLIKAEIFRELGDFEMAELLLDRISAPKLAGTVHIMRELCAEGDTRVRELPSPY